MIRAVSPLVAILTVTETFVFESLFGFAVVPIKTALALDVFSVPPLMVSLPETAVKSVEKLSTLKSLA